MFEFIADEFDALAVGTIDEHYIGFNTCPFAVINAINELADDGSFARS